jgi:hypothetical protein
MANTEQVKSLLSQFPDPDRGGRYADLNEEEMRLMRTVVAQLRDWGREAVLGLIELLVEPGRGNDIKARYALHLLAVEVTQKGRESARAAFAQAVASQLGGPRPKLVQAWLIEPLQLAGAEEVVRALRQALLEADLCDPAARALAVIRDGAAEALLEALPKTQGRQRLSIIQNLAVLRAAPAAPAFRQALTDGDADVRVAGAWGLARLAESSAAEALLQCAEAHDGWERFNETDACLALAESLAAAGKKAPAKAIYERLEKTRTDASERHVREAAARGLAALSRG